MIITIDGTSGTGKSTVAKKVAELLQFSFFDTGAMYRSVAWLLIKKELPLSSVEKILSDFSFSIESEGNKMRYFVNGIDVTDEIRTERITEMASKAAAVPSVRKALWSIQRAFAEENNAVFEGRDMGSVVFPQADLKVFLIADPKVRAQRRLSELMEKFPGKYTPEDFGRILSEILNRDTFDTNRELAPLRCPEQALVIDTSGLSIDEVVNKILEHSPQP